MDNDDYSYKISNLWFTIILLFNDIEACRDPLLGNDGETRKQRPLLDNRFLISKYTQPLLSNAFANKHFPLQRIHTQQL
jgi:hypothetical protein